MSSTLYTNIYTQPSCRIHGSVYLVDKEPSADKQQSNRTTVVFTCSYKSTGVPAGNPDKRIASSARREQLSSPFSRACPTYVRVGWGCASGSYSCRVFFSHTPRKKEGKIRRNAFRYLWVSNHTCEILLWSVPSFSKGCLIRIGVVQYTPLSGRCGSDKSRCNKTTVLYPGVVGQRNLAAAKNLRSKQTTTDTHLEEAQHMIEDDALVGFSRLDCPHLCGTHDSTTQHKHHTNTSHVGTHHVSAKYGSRLPPILYTQPTTILGQSFSREALTQR